MAIKSLTDLETEIDSIFADNAAPGSITMEIFRNFAKDIVQSCLNITTNTNLQGLYEYDPTIQYNTGQWVIYSYKWYKANTIPPVGAFDSSKWDFQGYVTYTKTLTIASVDVLQLNSVPKILIPNVSGRTIFVKNCRASLAYNSAAYATNTTLQIYMDVGGAPNIQFTIPTILTATANQHRVGTITAAAQLSASADVKVNVASGDPTAGNSPITIYCEYQVLD